MDLNQIFIVEEVLKIINTLSLKDKEIIKSTFLLEEAEFERLVKEDFAKYEATFKALSQF